MLKVVGGVVRREGRVSGVLFANDFLGCLVHGTDCTQQMDAVEAHRK